MAGNSTLNVTYRTRKTGTGTQDTQKEMTGLQGAMKNLSSTALALAGPAALGAVTAGLKFAISEAMEAERVMALTRSTIQATGGAAGLTAEQVSDMAGRLSQMTGIADDVIQSGQNMLLTFKEIKGDTFERATRAMNDMAVAMNGGSLEGLDLKATSIQLGKALNDPLKGLTALSKVGVSFTEAQKAAIREMVEMNDIAGAQAVILSELESEFGGAAEAAGNTLTGSIAKLKNAVSELAEAFGTELLPPLTEAANAAVLLIQWNDRLTDVCEQHMAQVARTAESYEAYLAEAIRVAELTGKLNKGYVDATGNGIRLAITQEQLVEELGFLTPAQLKAVQAVDKFGVSAYTAGLAARQLVIDQYNAAQGAEAAGLRYQGLADSLGVVGQRQFELGLTAAQLAAAEAASAEAAAQAADAQAAAQASLDARVTGYYNLAAALKDATAQELAQTQLGQLDELFKNGVLSQDQYKTATESLGLAFGIFTPQSLALARATDELVKLYAAGKISADDLTTATGNLQAAAADGEVALDELGIAVAEGPATEFAYARDRAEEFIGTVERIPRVVDVRVNVNYNTPVPPDVLSSLPTPGQPGYNPAQTNFATGGRMIVPPGFWNDDYRIGVSTGEEVIVRTPAQQAAGSPVGGGDTYNYYIYAGNADAQGIARLLKDDETRRRTGARRN